MFRTTINEVKSSNAYLKPFELGNLPLFYYPAYFIALLVVSKLEMDYLVMVALAMAGVTLVYHVLTYRSKRFIDSSFISYHIISYLVLTVFLSAMTLKMLVSLDLVGVTEPFVAAIFGDEQFASNYTWIMFAFVATMIVPGMTNWVLSLVRSFISMTVASRNIYAFISSAPYKRDYHTIFAPGKGGTIAPEGMATLSIVMSLVSMWILGLLQYEMKFLLIGGGVVFLLLLTGAYVVYEVGHSSFAHIAGIILTATAASLPIAYLSFYLFSVKATEVPSVMLSIATFKPFTLALEYIVLMALTKLYSAWINILYRGTVKHFIYYGKDHSFAHYILKMRKVRAASPIKERKVENGKKKRQEKENENNLLTDLGYVLRSTNDEMDYVCLECGEMVHFALSEDDKGNSKDKLYKMKCSKGHTTIGSPYNAVKLSRQENSVKGMKEAYNHYRAYSEAATPYEYMSSVRQLLYTIALSVIQHNGDEYTQYLGETTLVTKMCEALNIREQSSEVGDLFTHMKAIEAGYVDYFDYKRYATLIGSVYEAFKGRVSPQF